MSAVRSAGRGAEALAQVFVDEEEVKEQQRQNLARAVEQGRLIEERRKQESLFSFERLPKDESGNGRKGTKGKRKTGHETQGTEGSVAAAGTRRAAIATRRTGSGGGWRSSPRPRR